MLGRALAVLTAALLAAAVAGSSIQVDVSAPWHDTSLLAEAAEAIRALDPTAVRSFIDAVDRHATSPLPTAKAEFAAAKAALTSALPASAADAIAVELNARLWSPKVATFQADGQRAAAALSGPCPAIFVAGDDVKCATGLVPAPPTTCIAGRPTEIHFGNVSCLAGHLYGSLADKAARQLLLSWSSAGVSFAFRHYDASVKGGAASGTIGLSGYGVTVDVKNMEYQTVNKKDAQEIDYAGVEGIDGKLLSSRFPALQHHLDAFFQAASSEEEDALDLNVWELTDLGLQATLRVVGSDEGEQLSTLVDTLHNFPARASVVSKMEASTPAARKVRAAVENTQAMTGEGGQALYLNRRQVTLKTLSFYSMLDTFRGEQRLLQSIQTALNASTVNADVAAVRSCALSHPESDAKPRILLPPDMVAWMNNIEEDEAYAYMGSPLGEALKPGYYGRPRLPRRNLMHIVYVIDFSRQTDFSAVTGMYRMMNQGIPARIGVFVAPTTPLNRRIAAVLQRLSDQSSSMGFLWRLIEVAGVNALSLEDVDAAAASFKAGPVDEAFEAKLEAQQRQVSFETVPALLFNGLVFTEGIEQAIYQSFHTEFERAKGFIREKALKDSDTDLYTKLQTLLGARSRYHAKVFAPTFSALAPAEAAAVPALPWLFAPKYNLEVAAVSHVLYVAGAVATATPVVQWLTTCSGACTKARLAIVACGASVEHVALQAVVMHADANVAPKKRAVVIAAALEKFTAGNTVAEVVADVDKAVRDGATALARDAAAAISANAAMCGAVASAGTTQLRSNARVTEIDTAVQIEDVEHIDTTERVRGEQVSECLQFDFIEATGGNVQGSDLTSAFYADKALLVSGVLVADAVANGRRVHSNVLPRTGAASISFGAAGAAHEVVAVIDPVSREGQRLAALVEYAVTAFKANGAVHMNPPLQLTKVPIKNFYKFVAPTELLFDHNGKVLPPRTMLEHMPRNAVLTLGLDEPESWLVFPEAATADLDNIKFDKDSTLVTASYALESLLVTGSCYEGHTPPRGLNLELHHPALTTRDTLVMSNLGYFQLQALPGHWGLRLRTGRSRDIFAFSTINEAAVDPDMADVFVDSFAGVHLDLAVQRRPGMESADLLKPEPVAKPEDEDEGAGGGLLSGLFGGGDDSKKVVTQETTGDDGLPTLNIFSLASGHLYERFMRIMMSTVMKTLDNPKKSRVKFWLIENPLSPQFKKLLPHLAKRFGFEYALVSYKWPTWLRKQTEKQRFIWAYKILFLDVLFPMNIKKVIFVDADQIVRSDLHELFNMDLKGAPVAYTPFCQKAMRKETKGFRFWDSGFWSDHLRGLPYHISAIYVVDLERMRMMGAGDTYRVTYERLSADPNSLSNLDQDLPNFAQHEVPIHSLPEEWLWCETWCNDGSKAAAKTIDLCNNPQTKTPKLENAKRIVPEWEETDRELSAFADSVLKEE